MRGMEAQRELGIIDQVAVGSFIRCHLLEDRANTFAGFRLRAKSFEKIGVVKELVHGVPILARTQPSQQRNEWVRACLP
jgi:hypothetical protein